MNVLDSGLFSSELVNHIVHHTTSHSTQIHWPRHRGPRTEIQVGLTGRPPIPRIHASGQRQFAFQRSYGSRRHPPLSTQASCQTYEAAPRQSRWRTMCSTWLGLAGKEHAAISRSRLLCLGYVGQLLDCAKTIGCLLGSELCDHDRRRQSRSPRNGAQGHLWYLVSPLQR